MRVWCMVWLPVLSDAEHFMAERSFGLLLPKTYSMSERLIKYRLDGT